MSSRELNLDCLSRRKVVLSCSRFFSSWILAFRSTSFSLKHISSSCCMCLMCSAASPLSSWSWRLLIARSFPASFRFIVATSNAKEEHLSLTEAILTSFSAVWTRLIWCSVTFSRLFTFAFVRSNNSCVPLNYGYFLTPASQPQLLLVRLVVWLEGAHDQVHTLGLLLRSGQSVAQSFDYLNVSQDLASDWLESAYLILILDLAP